MFSTVTSTHRRSRPDNGSPGYSPTPGSDDASRSTASTAIDATKDSGAAPVAPSTGKPRMPGLDVMRGAAILLVMLRHSWGNTFPNGGIVGVVLFFALSGYLITGVINSEMTRRGRLSYWRFYRNRFLRLYPALIAMLAIFAAVGMTLDLLDDKHKVWRSVLGGVTYTTDLWTSGISAGIAHLWTLAIEEQFYLVWPIILVFAIRRRLVGAVLIVGLVGLTALCAYVIFTNKRVIDVYVYPSSWAVTLLIGSAGYLNRDWFRGVLLGWRGRIAAILAVAFVVFVTFLPEAKSQSWLYLVGGPAIALCSVILILQAEKWRKMPVVLTPLRALGLISYAAYLWNYLIRIWLNELNDGRPSNMDRLLMVVLTLAAATLSWWLVEKPFAEYRKRLDARERSAGTAVASRQPATAPR